MERTAEDVVSLLLFISDEGKRQDVLSKFDRNRLRECRDAVSTVDCLSEERERYGGGIARDRVGLGLGRGLGAGALAPAVLLDSK